MSEHVKKLYTLFYCCNIEFLLMQFVVIFYDFFFTTMNSFCNSLFTVVNSFFIAKHSYIVVKSFLVNIYLKTNLINCTLVCLPLHPMP